MDKKLPNIFANKDIGNVKNNEDVYRSYTKKDDSPSLIGKSVNQKIQTIFNSNNYIYKADVVITLEDEVVTKRIIGKTANHLITNNNELISIDKIVDINYKK